MTTAVHDDRIEIIAFETEATTPSGEPTPQVEERCLPVRVVVAKKDDPPTKKQKRVARIVGVIAGLLLLMSLVLVGVTLSMSDHIDEMVRKVNGIGATTSYSRPWPATTTKVNTTSGSSSSGSSSSTSNA